MKTLAKFFLNADLLKHSGIHASCSRIQQLFSSSSDPKKRTCCILKSFFFPKETISTFKCGWYAWWRRQNGRKNAEIPSVAVIGGRLKIKIVLYSEVAVLHATEVNWVEAWTYVICFWSFQYR